MSERLIIRTTGQTGPSPVVSLASPGGSDDTALFTAAEAALPAAGGCITLAPGAYALPSGYAFAKRVRLVGQGLGDPYAYTGSAFPASTLARGITSILVSSETADGITFAVDGSSAEHLAIVNTATTPSAGAGLKSTSSNLLRLHQIAVVGFYDCVDINNGGLWDITGSWIGNPVRYGVRIRNVDVPDEGDAFIGAGTTIYTTSRNGTAGINWESGGGLKVQGVKINGNTGKFVSGIRFNTAAGISTSVGAITGCSIENVNVAIDFNRQGASGTYGSIAIVGNEIGAGSGGSSYGILCQSAGFSQIHIADNVIRDYAFPIILNHGDGIYVGPNTFLNISNAATNGAVTIGSSATNVAVAPQHVYENDYITFDNSAAATPAMFDYDYTYPLGTITGTATTLWRLAVPNNNAGTIDFDVSGNAVGVGAFTIRGTRSYTKATGAVTVATVGTDVEVGGTTGIAVTFDTAAVSGEVQIKVATAGSASDIDGVAHMNVRGRLSSLKRGA